MPIPYSGNPMGHTRERLPQGYRRVEYLESTGTQWIDTGVKPDASTRWRIKLAQNPSTVTQDFGCYDSPKRLYIGKSTNDEYFIWAGDERFYFGIYAPAHLVVDVDIANGIVKANEKTFLFTSQLVPSDLNIALYAARYPTKADYFSKAKCWYSELYKGGICVQKLIPALDPSGRPCMYDLVEQKPYYNAATEGPDFLWGGDPEVELPAGYRRCTYLESDGASYIDTGMTQVNDYVFTAKTKPVLNMRLFGSGTQAPAFYTFMSGSFTAGSPKQAYNNSVLLAPNAFDPNKVQTVVISREGVSIDDKQFAFSEEPAGQFTAPESIKLFGYVGSSGAKTITAGTTIYYYSVIRRNGSKEMELVPCLSTDNTPCMVDTVTGTVYTNHGEGTFLWG